MKYQWEEPSEKMKKNIKNIAEGTIQGEIIFLAIFNVFIFGITVYCIICFKNNILRLIVSLILLVVTLFFLVLALVTKIRSFLQAKSGKFLKLETEFVRFSASGRNGTSIVVLVMNEGKLEEDDYKLLGVKPRNIKKGNKITLIRTKCDYDVFIAH